MVGVGALLRGMGCLEVVCDGAGCSDEGAFSILELCPNLQPGLVGVE